jgi:hypothetical protein
MEKCATVRVRWLWWWCSRFTVEGVVDRVEGGEVRSVMGWARVRAVAADGVFERQIAARLGINRRTVRRLMASAGPPRYRRASAGSMLDPLEPVLLRLVEEWPEIRAPGVTGILRADYGDVGSVDVVKKRLARLRPRAVRPAQRTGYRPGQVAQLDWRRCRRARGSVGASVASMR